MLGIAGSCAAILALAWAYAPTSFAKALPSLAGSLVLAASGSIAVWSVGGLEQPLIAGLLAWTLVLSFPLLGPQAERHHRAWLLPSATLALLCWTRPDGALFAAGAAVGLIAGAGFHRASLGLSIRLVLLPLLAFAAQMGFRLAYYGDWIPNSARAKVAFTWTRLADGLAYLGSGALWLGPLLLLVPLLAIPAARRDAAAARRLRFLLVPFALWAVYVAVIGGDIFHARRHFAPLVVVLALLLAEGLRVWVRRGDRRTAFAWAASAACLLLLLQMQLKDPENRGARDLRWQWNGEVVARLLRAGFGEQQPLLAVESAGTVPYFSGFPAVDMFGINDRFLARNRPADFGQGWLGHELGSGPYVLGREPDLVVFCHGSPRPCSRGGEEMFADPRFGERYRLVPFLGKDPYPFRSEIWVRMEEGRIGIRRELGRVVLPGYLMVATPGSIAELDPEGRLAVKVTADVPAAFDGFHLEPGHWILLWNATGARVTVEIRSRGRPWLYRREPGSAFDVRAGDEGVVDLLVRPTFERTSWVSEIVFERKREAPEAAERGRVR